MLSLLTFHCWPMPPPVLRCRALAGVIIVAGVVFSLVMLIDRLKRRPDQFPHPLTSNGQYDKLIWATAIIVSFWLYFLGPIVYYFVVRKARTKGSP